MKALHARVAVVIVLALATFSDKTQKSPREDKASILSIVTVIVEKH
jgi:phosphotransferase system HPr-like phosphotransfer protein